MVVTSVTRSDLIALARKYRVLSELRRRHEHFAAEEARLAEEFPGALHELDRLPLDEVEHRVEAIERVLRSGGVTPWMLWVHAYHGSMRAALYVRRRLAGRSELAHALAREIAAEAERASGFHCDVEVVYAIAEGRAPSAVVLSTLERELSVSHVALTRVLFARAES